MQNQKTFFEATVTAVNGSNVTVNYNENEVINVASHGIDFTPFIDEINGVFLIEEIVNDKKNHILHPRHSGTIIRRISSNLVDVRFRDHDEVMKEIGVMCYDDSHDVGDTIFFMHSGGGGICI